MRDGWQTKKLGDICRIERGGSPRPIQNFITTDSKGINWIKIGDATASGKYIYKTEEKIRPEGAKRSRRVYEGDFILSNSMSFGRPYIMKTTGCIHDGWLVLHQPRVDPDYLYHVLSSDLVFEQFDRLAAGATVRNLNIGSVKSVEIPYPPLHEQRRIVAILDEAFERIATAKSNAEKNVHNARCIFESHLQSVFARRGDGWAVKKVGAIANHSLGKMLDKSKNKGELRPYLRNINVRWFTFDLSNVLQMPFLSGEMERCTAVKGDVLICEGGYPGRAAIWEDDQPICFQKALHRVRFHEPQLNKWFVYYLYAQDKSGELRKHFSGAGIQHFTGKALARFELPVPPMPRLRRAVAMFEELSSDAERLSAVYERKLAALELLKKSLLHDAFIGNL